MAHQDNSTLFKRILSSLVLAPLAMGAVFYGDWPYHIFLALLFVIAVHEWGRLARRCHRPFLITLLGILYLLGGFTSFVIVRADPAQGLVATLVLLVTVWASDIGAYVSGKAIGRARVAPRISPGKTYAGLAGAFVSGGAVPPIAALLGHSVLDAPEMQLAVLSWPDPVLLILLGIIVGISGQCGDFLMSFIKRKAGVKDTGTLIPGHGGVLDRIDALLLSGPVYLCMIILLAQMP